MFKPKTCCAAGPEKRFFQRAIATLLILFCANSFTFAQHGQLPLKKEHKPQSPGSKIISNFKYPSIDWRVPKVGRDILRLVLPNGMIVYLKEDHTLPVVSVQSIIRTGEVYETRNKHGVARLTGAVMRTGGTAKYSPDEFNKELEYMDAVLTSSIDLESGDVDLELLAKYLPKGLELLAELLRNPAFDEKKLSLAKSQIKEEIRRRNDEPDQILKREFNKKIYSEHPYGWEYEWPIVSSINRQDLIEWHKKFVHPNNIILGVSGDFKKAELLVELNKLFGDWPKGDIAYNKLPPVSNSGKPGVFIIPKEQNQTYIQIGHLGVNRNNSDRYAIEVMNWILGGGSFSSRITEKVRNDEGLAYSVGSRYQLGNRDLGTFFAYCQTKVSTTHKATDLILKEIEKIRSQNVLDQELKAAKDSIINRFLFEFTSAEKIVGRLMMLEYNEMPKDFYEKYREQIQKISKDDILVAAKKHLRPNDFTFVFVGNPKEFDNSPDSFGKVEIIPLADAVKTPGKL